MIGIVKYRCSVLSSCNNQFVAFTKLVCESNALSWQLLTRKTLRRDILLHSHDEKWVWCTSDSLSTILYPCLSCVVIRSLSAFTKFGRTVVTCYLHIWRCVKHRVYYIDRKCCQILCFDVVCFPSKWIKYVIGVICYLQISIINFIRLFAIIFDQLNTVSALQINSTTFKFFSAYKSMQYMMDTTELPILRVQVTLFWIIQFSELLCSQYRWRLFELFVR